MRLSDLQNKDIINIKDGKRAGKIIDALIDEEGNMKALIIQRLKIFNLTSGAEVEVKWNQIKKIGTDVILVDM